MINLNRGILRHASDLRKPARQPIVGEAAFKDPFEANQGEQTSCRTG
ncbi:hypothetical protein [Stutzerimonas nitrititolerans]|nr:hypothetical protein [Stutzerimonas nitrititolerans]